MGFLFVLQINWSFYFLYATASFKVKSFYIHHASCTLTRVAATWTWVSDMKHIDSGNYNFFSIRNDHIQIDVKQVLHPGKNLLGGGPYLGKAIGLTKPWTHEWSITRI